MATKRELDMGMKCIKYLLCACNFMFVIVGLLLISIGYTIKVIYQSIDVFFMDERFYHPSSLAIVIGFFIFIVAMFGCIGALKESTFLVNIYAFFLAIILILQISVCIAAYAMRSNIKSSLYHNMENSMYHYDNELNALAWNSTQYNLQCCGIFTYTEWNRFDYNSGANFPLENMVYWNGTKTGIYIPSSCCVNENCTIFKNNFGDGLNYPLYYSGCLDRLTYIISQCALLLGVGALCVSFIQVLGIVFASMLAKSIRKIKTHRIVEKDEQRRQFYEQMIKNDKKDAVFPELYIPKESEA